MWSEAPDTSARFGIDANTGWNGTHQGTQGIGHGGQLSLATKSTLATLTDFETLIETLPDWVGQGGQPQRLERGAPQRFDRATR